MILTPRITAALELAARLHREHTRRDNLKTPYITHLFSVMLLASQVTHDEDTLISALMHDSLEDVAGYTKEMLQEDTNERVATIVSHVTEPFVPVSPEIFQKPWLERKQAYLDNLAEGPVESAIVSAADKIHNITALLRDYKEEGEPFIARFHGSTTNQLWFYEEVTKIIVSRLPDDNLLRNHLEKVLAEAKEYFRVKVS